MNAESPAALPAVTAAAYNGSASNPFAEHASARRRRPRSWDDVSLQYKVGMWAGTSSSMSALFRMSTKPLGFRRSKSFAPGPERPE
jgi:hypothetical protein